MGEWLGGRGGVGRWGVCASEGLSGWYDGGVTNPSPHHGPPTPPHHPHPHPRPSGAGQKGFPDLSGALVLVVDDHEQNLELVEAYLEEVGCRVKTALDGVECLRLVREEKPDLILLDIMMPRMSGFQVCRKLKNDPKTRDIQILMVTALNELCDIEQASECGTDDFVSKPVNKFELLTRVKSLLRVRHLKSELERALTYLNEIEHDEEVL